MKRMLILLAFLTAVPAYAVTLQIDPNHSQATFSVKHMMVTTVRGDFGKVNGTIDYQANDPSRSRADIKIDATSLDTRNEKRDGHLKSPDFFDVAKCPDITFKSNKIEKGSGEHQFKVTGDLTMHCVTKPVTLTVDGPNGPIKHPSGANVYAATATGKLNRKDFGLTWNKALEGGGVMVSDEVNMNIDLEMTESKPDAQKEAQAETNKKK
ncbi:MAG TPA: YceI family protein [Myxococcales bacterium]|nr:YceI family protein [Myxococcales bacterium]